MLRKRYVYAAKALVWAKAEKVRKPTRKTSRMDVLWPKDLLDPKPEHLKISLGLVRIAQWLDELRAKRG